MPPLAPTYRGRLAPSPTGFLHLGHARTFWIAQQRARAAGGRLRLRNDDLDAARCRPEFAAAQIEDLRWLGLEWDEPVVSQSERLPLYRAALVRLHAVGAIYACTRSRRDVQAAAGAPHDGDEEPLFPPRFRPPADARFPPPVAPVTTNWRFRVTDGETLTFMDGREGPQTAVAGRDFGDFIVWRKDDVPSYQLACVVDDNDLGITEVVRGADLKLSTFRQLLLYRALGLPAPAFYHCALVTDERGVRLAKRNDALALRTLRAAGRTPAQIAAEGGWIA
ncbi:MAG: tRNA glutamyl-Q(34) synthetase GluQRS [Opitutaceae bacterium]|nr:tRNA glutamyl-Q(34) synthetase GluQRS [Opitutaceae bacterium]